MASLHNFDLNKGKFLTKIFQKQMIKKKISSFWELAVHHGLRTSKEEIAFTARPKIHSHSQNFRHGRSIFCLPSFSDIFDLCLHWVSIVRAIDPFEKMLTFPLNTIIHPIFLKMYHFMFHYMPSLVTWDVVIFLLIILKTHVWLRNF